jgi:hypothetical protein
MSDKKINSPPGSAGFVPPAVGQNSFKENTSAYLGHSVVCKNSMFRLVKTPLGLLSFNPAKLPLQTRANTRTQKSQLAAEGASTTQRQQSVSGVQASSAKDDDESEELDNEESGLKKSASMQSSGDSGMSAAKKPTSFAIKAPDQTTEQASKYRTVANLRERQQELEQALARSKLPGVELLVKAPGPDVTRSSLLPTFAMGLLTAVNLPNKAGSLPARISAMLMMSRAFIQAVPPQESERVSAGVIKQCLVAAAEKNPPPARAATPDEGLENSLVLLPLMMINACRFRPPERQQHAINTMGLIIASKTVA